MLMGAIVCWLGIDDRMTASCGRSIEAYVNVSEVACNMRSMLRNVKYG